MTVDSPVNGGVTEPAFEDFELTEALTGEHCLITFWSNPGSHRLIVMPRPQVGTRVLTEESVESAVSWCRRQAAYFDLNADPRWTALWLATHEGYSSFRVERIRRGRSAARVFEWLFEHFDAAGATRLLGTSILTGGPLGQSATPKPP